MSSMITPAAYWRANRDWPAWLNKQGEVLAVTMVTVPVPSLQKQAPYQLALIDFGDTRRTLMVAAGSEVQEGDHVITVLRRIAEPSPDGVIPYGIKIQKIS